MHWLSIVGLAADIAGVVIIASPIIFATDKEIIDTTAPMWGGTDDENAKLPAAGAKRHERARNRLGVALLVGGFALQAVAVLPR